MTPANSGPTAPETPERRAQSAPVEGTSPSRTPPKTDQAAAASGAGLEWREYPLVIVHTEDDRPQERRRRARSVHFSTDRNDDDDQVSRNPGILDEDFDSMSLDDQNDPLPGSGGDANDGYERTRRRRSSDFGNGDVTISEVPAWDTAYWRYTKKLRRAVDYIQKSRNQTEANLGAWRETLEQSLDYP